MTIAEEAVPLSVGGWAAAEWDIADGRRERTGHTGWSSIYMWRVITGDVLSVAGAAFGAWWLKRWEIGEGMLRVEGQTISYTAVALAAVPLWLLLLAVGGAYDRHNLEFGPDEFRRVVRAGVLVFVLASVFAFMSDANLSRVFVAGMIPLGVGGTVVGREINRRWLRRRRRSGDTMKRVLLVGSSSVVPDVARYLDDRRWSGFEVVAACLSDPNHQQSLVEIGDRTVPVLGSVDTLLETVAFAKIDVLIVTSRDALPSGRLRSLEWELEDDHVDLFIAPAVTDVAGPRITIRPVSGVPLLHVRGPRLAGPSRVAKACFERSVATLATIALLPLFLTVAALIRLTSRGPALFTQLRLGKDRKPFRVYKFRTMVVDAEQQRDQLDDRNEADGCLFKMQDDPRITRVGRLLRRTSIDELPQLFNVVKGEMSLVGPRPLPLKDVRDVDRDFGRRLLVRPGLTGLGQVNGRSELSWDESLDFDLHYVDNWSPTMDATILAKTVKAVVSGRGAY